MRRRLSTTQFVYIHSDLVLIGIKSNRTMKWILFIGLAFLVELASLFITHLYFQWLLPFKDLKDWIIGWVFIPLTIGILFSNVIGMAGASLVLPDTKIRRAWVFVFIFMILSFVYNVYTNGIPLDSMGDRLNLFQTISLTAYSIYRIYSNDYIET
ncbi:MAG: hypothetical protein JWQ09_946 [Segetibacter sp.]|nr:hypothetical protein [Segetibacter sp.]